MQGDRAMKQNIEIGARFQRISPPHHLWEVEDLIDDHDGLAHARLIRIDCPKEYRVLAAETLANGRTYRRVDEDGAKKTVERAPLNGVMRFFTIFFA